MKRAAKILYRIKRFGNSLFTRDCVHCGKAVLGKCLCEKCEKNLSPYPGNTEDSAFAYVYSEGARSVMLRFKFEDDYEFCSDTVYDWISEGYSFFGDKKFDAVIPVPSFGKEVPRFHKIVKRLCIMNDLPFRPELLEKIRETEKQHSLPAAKRKTNLLGAFSAADSVKGLSVLLVDDIYTTGSTVLECRKALFEKGAAEVFILVVLKTTFE